MEGGGGTPRVFRRGITLVWGDGTVPTDGKLGNGWAECVQIWYVLRRAHVRAPFLYLGHVVVVVVVVVMGQ